MKCFDCRLGLAGVILVSLCSLSWGQTTIPAGLERPDFGDPTPAPTTTSAPAPTGTPPPATGPATRPTPTSWPATATAPATQPNPALTTAKKEMNKALELLASGDILQARAKLSEVYFAGQLDEASQTKALAKLTDLADKTIFSDKVYEGDPYVYAYTFKATDLLQNVIKKEQLLVGPKMIERLNGVDAGRLRANQTIKLLRGPLHAVVSKSGFTVDLYLQRDGQPKTFFKRMKCALGKDNATPIGSWLVVRKASRAKWTPPASAGSTTPIAWGQVGYPLGKEGYWIALQGTDENTRSKTGYGIHGTNEPESIGKAASLGCIRLADDDIELVYSGMAPEISTVVIQP